MIRKMYDRVYQRLRDNPQCRNSDRQLMLEIWEGEGLYLSATQKAKFMEVSSPETIRRTRQKVQEDGYFPADAKVKQYRQENESEVTAEVVIPKMEQQAISWLND